MKHLFKQNACTHYMSIKENATYPITQRVYMVLLLFSNSIISFTN